jgi:hypothetical protein
MASNKSKTDKLHDLLPKHLNTKTNVNWAGLLSAIGESDDGTSDLIEQVRKQFFIKTASRPYIDRLAANHKISRPGFIGMDDTSFRDYVPVLSYQPKQVKLIIDKLLDIFFFKESTTAFVTSQLSAPFAMEDGWELEYKVDELNSERIVFTEEEFTDITASGAAEVVASINRQAKYSYATVYSDSVTKEEFIRLFTKTTGSKGSIRIQGGRSNAVIQFNGFIDSAGAGDNTEWTVTKIGDKTAFQYTGGVSPGLDNVRVGDIVIINLTGNVGSFEIKTIDISDNKFTFVNLFGTAGVQTQTDSNQVKFIRPNKYTAYTNPRRAMVWETSPGEITVEMPTSPPVVKRSLKGSFHVNGIIGIMESRDADDEITLEDAKTFPKSGSFYMEPLNEIHTRLLTQDDDLVVTKSQQGRLQYGSQKYSYETRVEATTAGDIEEGSDRITNIADTTGIAIGQSIFMDGVRGDAEVLNIVGDVVTMSVEATLTAVAAEVEFAGDTLYGITPELPVAAGLNQYTLSSLVRTSNELVGTTSTAHNYSVGEYVIVGESSGMPLATTTGDISSGSDQLTNLASVGSIAPGMIVTGTGIPTGTTILELAGSTATMSQDATATTVGVTVNINEDINNAHLITEITSTTWTATSLGPNGTSVTPGKSRVERPGLADAGSKIIGTTSRDNGATRITGSYAWDSSAPFVLSSATTETEDDIQAGRIVSLYCSPFKRWR